VRARAAKNRRDAMDGACERYARNDTERNAVRVSRRYARAWALDPKVNGDDGVGHGDGVVVIENSLHRLRRIRNTLRADRILWRLRGEKSVARAWETREIVSIQSRIVRRSCAPCSLPAPRGMLRARRRSVVPSLTLISVSRGN